MQSQAASDVPELFSIYNLRGKRMYINMARDTSVQGYSWRWRNSNGFVTDEQIAFGHWTVESQNSEIVR